VINYTYARTRPIIERMNAPATWTNVMARVRYQSHQRRPGAVYDGCGPAPRRRLQRRKHRATDGLIFVCVEGKGMTTVDGKVLEWGPNDVFIVPP
jgi:gentisate 1,2-dioxygenase